MKKIACTLTSTFALIILSLSTFATDAVQHDVSLSVMDHDDFDNNFVRFKYHYYLKPITDDGGVLSINPYLQRTGHVRFEHLNLGTNNRTAVGAEYYFDSQWRVSGKISYSKDNGNNFDQRDYGLDAEVGYFLNDDIEIGVRREFEFDPAISLYSGRVNSKTNYAVFARYIDIHQNQGWDWKAQYYIDSDDNVAQVSTDYYMNQMFSVGAQYTYADRELRPEDGAMYYRLPKNRIALNTRYWLTQGLSITATLAQNIGNRAGIESAQVVLNYRF